MGQHRRDNFELGHLLLEALHIFVNHAPLAPFAESGIRLGGGLCPYYRRVGGKAFKVFLQQLFQSLSSSEKRHKHEHAPEYAESGKEAAALVSRKRVENLAVTVYVKSHLF